jgi:hypothetical protein
MTIQPICYYFPKWAWKLACERNPEKYTMPTATKEAVYKGGKVILT